MRIDIQAIIIYYYSSSTFRKNVMINTGVKVVSLDAHTSVLGSYTSLAATKSVPLILKRPRIYSCIGDLLPAVRILWCT